MVLGRLRDRWRTRKTAAYEGYEKRIYKLVRTKSAADVSAYCRRRGFSAAEEAAVLSLVEIAVGRGYDDFARLLAQRAADGGAALPFEPRLLPEHADEDARALERMRGAAEGRRVILTGPADYTVGAGRGEWVEGFDWVVRLNFQWPLPDTLAPDLGRRLDVLYHCCNGDHPVERLFVPGFERAQFVCLEHQAHSLRLMRHCRALGVPYLYTTATIARLTAALGHPPSTGLTAIEHLLSLPIRELQLYGITLWHAPYYAGYAGDGARAVQRRHGGVRRRVWRHAPRAERAHLLALIARDPRLRLDPCARQLLQAAG